jgi:hypothetical protein
MPSSSNTDHDGRYWVKGGDWKDCHGTSIGRTGAGGGAKVIDLAGRALCEGPWCVQDETANGALVVYGGLKVGAGDDDLSSIASTFHGDVLVDGADMDVEGTVWAGEEIKIAGADADHPHFTMASENFGGATDLFVVRDAEGDEILAVHPGVTLYLQQAAAAIDDLDAAAGTATSGGYGFSSAQEFNDFISSVNTLTDALAAIKAHLEDLQLLPTPETP